MKINYDGRPVNGGFWFFSGGLTNVEYILTVEDTITGESRTYSNEMNNPAPTILDTNPFTSSNTSSALPVPTK